MFYVDVAKIDRDVAYVASVSETCCKHLLKIFYLLKRFLFGCCICLTHMLCFIRMLRMFAMVSSVFSGVFASFSYACFKCFIYFFRGMLQVCLSGCCICFIYMLQVFYFGCCVCLQWFQVFFHVFLQVFHIHILCISFVFRRML